MIYGSGWRSFDNVDTLSITETVYKGKIRPYGKTDGSLTDVHLPAGLAEELCRWKQGECKTVTFQSGSDCFHLSEYARWLHGHGELPQPCAEPSRRKLGLPKLNFQVMCRTMATQAQSMGWLRTSRRVCGTRRPTLTANEYMQELPESVKQKVGSVYTMLRKGGEAQQVSGDLLPNATNAAKGLAVTI